MISVTSFGKLDSPLRDRYLQRLKKLIPFDWREIPVKQMPSQRPPRLLGEEEKFLKEHKEFYLLDVEGKDLNSEAFRKFCFSASNRHLVVGPAVGFHPEFFKQAKGRIKLSSLTLTHELAQIMLAESIYRSVCLEKNHPFAK